MSVMEQPGIKDALQQRSSYSRIEVRVRPILILPNYVAKLNHIKWLTYYQIKNIVMPNAKNNIKNLISGIYECQKQILINRRFIRELETHGNSNNTSRLKYEIVILQKKIIAFQDELKLRFNESDY